MSLSEFLAELNASGVRLWLDQGALRYSCPAPGLRPDQLARLAAVKHDICQLIRRTSTHAPAQVAPANAGDAGATRLTFEQRRIWRSCLIAPQTRAFNICGQAELAGELNLAALEQALQEISRRHPVLRAHVDGPEDRCALVAGADALPRLPCIDLSGLVHGDAVAARLCDEESRRPFDLRRGPLLRALLIVRAPRRHALVLSLHHLVCDHWSVQVLTRELHALYVSYTRGGAGALAPLRKRFGDYAAAESARADGDGFADGLRFWESQLHGLRPTLLPSTADPGQDAIASEQAVLAAPALHALRAHARSRRVGLPVLLMTALFVLLREYVDQDDLCVGTTVVHRPHPDDEALIGLLINTLVLRCDLSGAATLDAVLARMKIAWNASVAHSDVPFQLVLDRIRPSLGPHALPFNVGVEIRADVSLASEQVPGLRVTPVQSRFVAPVRDLTLFLEEAADCLAVRFEYRSGAFAANAIAGLQRRYVALLQALPALLPSSIDALPVERPPDLMQALAQGASTIVDMLYRHAQDRPDAIALETISEDGASTQWSYAGLRRRVDRAAAAMRMRVGTETVVALCIGDPVECRIAALALMRAGAAPLALDPEWPAAQVDVVLAQVGALAVLADRAVPGVLPLWRWQDIAAGAGEAAPPAPPPASMAWVRVRDGAQAGAVAIEHRALVRAVEALAANLERASCARLLATAAPWHQAFLMELCLPLACGGTLVATQATVHAAAALMCTEPDVMHAVPGVVDRMLQARGLPVSLRVIVITAESLYADTLNRLFSQVSIERVVHGHACAESALVSSVAVIRRRDRGETMQARGRVDGPAIADLIRLPQPFDTQLAPSNAPSLDAASRRQVVQDFNATDRACADGLVHTLFEAQVARTPDAIAAVDANEQVSYAALDRRANRLARHLRACGVGPEHRVAVSVERGVPLLLALLATLKAGGAYVPLDPDAPPQRLAEMLHDSRPTVVLQTQRTPVPAQLVGAAQQVWLDQPHTWAQLSGAALAVPGLTNAQLAYVIYTSGSTGRPKGVMNAHRGVVNRLRWMQDAYALQPGQSVLQKTPCSFDVSVWEFFWPLLAGARLVFARPGGHRDPGYLHALIEREGIDTLHFVPSMLDAFVEEIGAREVGAGMEEVGAGSTCTSLTQVFCSGEALSRELAQRFAARWPQVGLHNLYGPTEAAVDVTAYACAHLPPAGEVPIGAPIANVRIYVLDTHGAPVPIGVPGELYIGGIAVARGYEARAGLTAERFVVDTHGPTPGARLYRTGDLGRWRADGTLDYLGRNDSQVKLRGHRIELGEIEACLRDWPQVREAAVVLHGTGAHARLVGYVTGAGAQSPDLDALRQHLRAHLPTPMLPAALVLLPAMPLTPNGKLDRKALPAPAIVAGWDVATVSVWEHESADPAGLHPVRRRALFAPIATPSTRANVQLLRRQNADAPLGATGRMAIRGAAIARGYLGQPGWTAERFQPDPASQIAGARRCLTDDFGRIGADGALYCLGADGDTLLHGRAIELPSLEGALRADQRVRAAAARIATDDAGRSSLTAYIVVDESRSIGIETELMQRLTEQLPEYMLPESLLRVRALPLAADGRLDRARLLLLDRQERTPSHSQSEGVLVGIWKLVLQSDIVDADRSFFELGGNSLNLLTAARLVSDRFQRKVTAADLLRHVSLRGLARHLDAANAHQDDGDTPQRRAAARLSALRERPRRASGARP
ncbi:amino acid adenylation domain-containing protein [Xanthomonas hortorum]